MQLDILQFYLLNLMTISWGRHSVVTVVQVRDGATMTWGVTGESSLESCHCTKKAPGCLGNPLKFLMCDDGKSSFLHRLPECSCPLPSCSAGQNREVAPPVETGDQKSGVTVT